MQKYNSSDEIGSGEHKFEIQKSKKKVNIEKILELIPDTPDIIKHIEPEKPSTLEDYYKLFED